MGRRNGNGGGRSLQQTLRRRVESCKSRFPTAEEIVSYLRSTYPEYQRTKYQTLVRFVHDASRSASRKKRKKIDEGEDMEEAFHLSMLGPPSTSSDFDETSELRNSYTGTKAVSVAEEKNVELDEGNTKATSTMNLGGGGEGKLVRKQVKGNGGGEVMKGKKGPRFKDFGGMKEILEKLTMEVLVPLYHPQYVRHMGMRPMTGILLHGPPGTGKTRLAQAVANETGLPFYHKSATEFVSGVSGASEENIRKLFDEAKRTAPCIVFIDEIDAIASKRENLQREMEKRIVTQLMHCMDQDPPADDSGKPRGYVLVIGATNRPDALDPALRRPGRFDDEIYVGFPDESAREEILSVLAPSLILEANFNLRKIARSTPGFIGADLVHLVNKAGILAIKRGFDESKRKRELLELLSQDLMSEHNEDWWKEHLLPEEIDKLVIKISDFEEALKMVQPSSTREGFSSIPDVKWEDVGGLDILRHEFERYIIRRIKYPEYYKRSSKHLETGFLLYGPPGCGKTLIAKAVANEAGANFIHIKGPELLNKYVGESELRVRTLFSRARECAPCILFFDEVDALTTERGKEGGWVIERLLNQLLVELDGAEQRKGVFVIGATNRPEVMDRALLRPGRFGKLLYVPLPSPDNRVLILKAIARNYPVDASVDLSAIARMKACENLSGADLSALMNEAELTVIDEVAAFNEKLTSTETTCDTRTIKTSHFEVALNKVSPSVLDMQRQYYQHLSESLKAA